MTDKLTPVSQDPIYEVVWPLGKSAYPPIALKDRLPDLNGKTVGELWDRLFRGEDVYPAVRATLKERFPGIRIVDYDHFGDPHGPRQKEALAELPELLKKYGCDAVITGIGA